MSFLLQYENPQSMDGYWKPWAEDNYLISTSEKQAQLLAQITEGKKK